ncbi:MAG: HAMP domain-containing protein [Candidatus Omnitrophica bacterium]|nr:HAMP domain-containing protein [Candidatus Omnitrophota bacterium]MBU1928278.1 HAMP domain-containing protein [Candidatus Omnitrophota bacterium]MBU2035566.1 HAMP domain-containing protein [Candidatus Omnitrophota bacterium]MBU2221799.1 HAMP domain-containing protein [Candidatus Omnitrophota bacterium]
MNTYVNSPWWLDAIKEANLRYENWESKAIQEYMARMDKQWVALSDNQLQEWLGSALGQRLKSLVENDSNIAEIFLTDQYGGLIAASGKTSDFYQADEEWWQLAYNNGIGHNYFGEVELDESSGVISSAIAIPARDEKGRIIAIVKAVVDISNFFKETENYIIDKTGHSVLINEYGRVIYCAGIKPMSAAPLSAILIKKLVDSKYAFSIINLGRSEKSIVSISEVNSTYFKRNNIHWYSVILQDEGEVFLPLYKIFSIVLIFTLVLSLFVIIFVQGITRKFFILPLNEINKGMRRFSEGKQDYRLNLKTGDEIEDLATSFNAMTDDLMSTTVSIERLNKEIVERKKAEDKLIKLLAEEIKSREIMASMLDDNNKIREDLERSLNELKEVQAQLIQSSKMATVGMLAGGVAHEINNPLTGVLNNVQLIKMIATDKKDFSFEEFKQLLDVIEESALRCTKITRSLLDFSHASKKESLLLSLNEIVEKVSILVTHELKLQNILIQQDFQPGLPAILGDPQLLQQVVFDLIFNAKWAIEKKSEKTGGAITIKTQYETGKNEVCLSISDSGIGISKENLDNIFQPFFSTKEVGQSTGLGLSIVYRIVSVHKGKITVESEVGVGTTFKISFPVISEI